MIGNMYYLLKPSKGSLFPVSELMYISSKSKQLSTCVQMQGYIQFRLLM